MLNEAIKKINEEMEKEKNPYVQVIGDFLLKHLEEIPEDAEKIMDKEKSIMKSLDEMQKAARKKKVGNYAVLTDQEGFEIVLKYFGINAKKKSNTSQEIKQDGSKDNEVVGIKSSFEDYLDF